MDRYRKLRALLYDALVKDAHRYQTTVGDLAQTLLSEGRDRRHRRISLHDQRALRGRWNQQARRAGLELLALLLTLDVVNAEGQKVPLRAPDRAVVSEAQLARNLISVRQRVRDHGHPDFVQRAR